MTKIVALLAFLGLWMLVGEATPVHMSLNDRQLVTPTDEVNGQPQTYIVLMANIQNHASMGAQAETETAQTRYTHLLQSIKQDTISTLDWNADPSTTVPLHVYTSVCHGFSAVLTPQEASIVRQKNGVLGVYPDTKYSLHTTRTPKFLGLNPSRGLLPEAQFGTDVIIAVFDTGVWPERDSFSDEGLGPIPARWRGICQAGQDFNASHCNKKVIGARYYVAGYERALLNETGKPLNETLEPRSPRDYDGHGSHTASTAAGSAVRNASLFGAARGTARGMAPKARIAVYKVCWLQGCTASDILAGMDQAVADGVDVFSLSLGSKGATPYFQDPIAIGSFGAMKRGIFVSCSGGNDGPKLQTIANYAPWIMTVGASSLDRDFPANVKLGNGQVVAGQSWYQLGGRRSSTLITGAQAAASNVTAAALCIPGALNGTLVKGKIVVCMRGESPRVEKSFVVLSAGGVGMVLINTPSDGENVIADPHFLPSTHVGARGASILLAYMSTTVTPVAKFQFLSARFNVKPAPVVAYFSSRGPNPGTPQVLKPDITGPGVNILAAWTGKAGPSGLPFDTREVNFNIISGTSMSCPHITGIAALLKSAHSEWSSAAIKSAMMTTASFLDNTGETITDQSSPAPPNQFPFSMPDKSAPGSPFLFGAGHVQPQKALDPGLVYDMLPQDYLNFLCALNYSQQAIQFINGGDSNFTCLETPVRLEDMNYPSFSAVFEERPALVPISMNMTRTLTNVGKKAFGCSTYRAKIILAPVEIKVRVYPDVLRFCGRNQKKEFTLEVTTVNAPSSSLVNVSVTDYAFLQWTDGRHHVVQSPISVTVQK